MPHEPLFQPHLFGAAQKAELDRVGHLALPGILTPEACVRLTNALSHIQSLSADIVPQPARYASEYDPYLASLVAHPQLLDMARAVLGPDIRFDHCVSLNRPGSDQGIHWHSHDYADDHPEWGFLRIFFYVNGFEPEDGGLKAVPGSHLFRDPGIRAATDEALETGWIAGKVHPQTGEPLRIEALSVPPGTVILMWTHAAHAVSQRQPHSPTRWAVVYAYRNPGAPSRARWISEEFEQRPPPGAEALMSLD